MLLNIYRKTKRHGFTIGMLVTLAMMASCAKTTSLTSHQEVWKYQTEGRITSTPLAYNGSIYFGSDDHKLYSIHAKTGKANWSYQADSPIRSNPQTSQASIIFQSNAGTVYALDAASGERKWSFSTNVQQGEQDEWDYYDSSAVIDNDTLYIGSADTRLYALNAKTIQSTPALYNGVIYLGACNFNLYAIQASSGKKIWELSEPAWVASPIYKDGVLYVGNSNGYFMQAVDSKSGKEIWRFQTNSNVLSAPALEKECFTLGPDTAIKIRTKRNSFMRSMPEQASLPGKPVRIRFIRLRR